MPRLHGFEWPSIAAAVILAAPLWCVAAPAMPDYPAHLASFALIGGEPSRYYTVAWAFLPNLSAEVLVPLLARWLPLELATRLFLTATIVLWVIGPAAIQRALFGRANPAALLAAVFAYNANFMWGFFNYTFSIGLDFFVLAAWIATDGRRTWLYRCGFAIAFTAIYFSHLFAFAVLLLAVTCLEISGWLAEQPRQGRSLALRAWFVFLTCLPAAFAFLILKPAAGGLLIEFDFADTLLDRIGAAIQFGFDKNVYVLTGALCLAFAGGIYRQAITVHPRMRLALLVLAIGAVLAPEWALGGWGVHMRLPAVLGTLTFASVQWKLSPRLQLSLTAAVLVLYGAAAAVVATTWHGYDAQFSEFRAHAPDIRQGARLLTVLDGDSLGWDSDQPYWHIAEFAVIDRGVFTPLMFTTAGQHIVHIAPPFQRIAATTAQQGSPPDVDELDDLAAGRSDADEDIGNTFPYLQFFQCHYDQAVVIHGRGPHTRAPAMLRATREGSFYTLYDIVPDARCAGR